MVCDEHFSDTDAKVVCRQLGYPTSEAVSRNTVYRSGSGTVWLGQVNCSGSEYALEACHHSSWETVQCCCHSEVVGVQCKNSGTDSPAVIAAAVTVPSLLIILVIVAMVTVWRRRREKRLYAAAYAAYFGHDFQSEGDTHQATDLEGHRNHSSYVAYSGGPQKGSGVIDQFNEKSTQAADILGPHVLSRSEAPSVDNSTHNQLADLQSENIDSLDCTSVPKREVKAEVYDVTDAVKDLTRDECTNSDNLSSLSDKEHVGNTDQVCSNTTTI